MDADLTLTADPRKIVMERLRWWSGDCDCRRGGLWTRGVIKERDAGLPVAQVPGTRRLVGSSKTGGWKYLCLCRSVLCHLWWFLLW